MPVIRTLAACMMAVAAQYHLPPLALPAIHAVEGGRVGAVVADRNGSFDLGYMQINSLWVPALARVTGWPRAVVFRDLARAPCFNIAAAGAILRLYIDQAHGNVLAALGDYHSHTPLRHARYLHRVLRAAMRLRAGIAP
ncbi:MAG: lytic transglycosylase domain-containing protein [Acetobacteraceae bacterium]